MRELRAGGGRSERLDGQRVEAKVDEMLQRIIHKAMPGETGLSFESRRGDAHPEMGAETGAIGPGMAGVRAAFVQHFERGWRKEFPQALLDRRRGDAGAHDLGASSAFM